MIIPQYNYVTHDQPPGKIIYSVPNIMGCSPDARVSQNLMKKSQQGKVVKFAVHVPSSVGSLDRADKVK